MRREAYCMYSICGGWQHVRQLITEAVGDVTLTRHSMPCPDFKPQLNMLSWKSTLVHQTLSICVESRPGLFLNRRISVLLVWKAHVREALQCLTACVIFANSFSLSKIKFRLLSKRLDWFIKSFLWSKEIKRSTFPIQALFINHLHLL